MESQWQPAFPEHLPCEAKNKKDRAMPIVIGLEMWASLGTLAGHACVPRLDTKDS